jgi:hypothetical protein
VLGRENAGYRLGILIARHKAALGGAWTRAKDAAFADMLLRYAGSSAEPAPHSSANFLRWASVTRLSGQPWLTKPRRSRP